MFAYLRASSTFAHLCPKRLRVLGALFARLMYTPYLRVLRAYLRALSIPPPNAPYLCALKSFRVDL